MFESTRRKKGNKWMQYWVRPVYNSQQRGITKVAFVDRWPLFGVSDFHEETYRNYQSSIGGNSNWP